LAVHKEFVPEGKTLNAKFCKAVMDGLLKRIHRVRSAALCSRNLFLLHDNAPAHKAASVYQFLNKKLLQPFITPVMSRLFLRQIYFLLSNLKMKLRD
jgi:hypothetical protein